MMAPDGWPILGPVAASPPAARTLGCVIAVALVSQCLAAPPNLDSANEAVDEPVRVGELEVRVVDPD